jgi:hypothetical protein
VQRSTSGPGATAGAAASASEVIRRVQTDTNATAGQQKPATSTDRREQLDRLVVDLERRLRREAERRRWRYGDLF